MAIQYDPTSEYDRYMRSLYGADWVNKKKAKTVRPLNLPSVAAPQTPLTVTPPELDARGRPKTTAQQEEQRLKAARQTAIGRIETSPELRDEPAEVNRLRNVIEARASGISQPVQDGFWNKVADIAVSKVLSPFKSAYKATVEAGGPVSLQNQGESWLNLYKGVQRIAQSAYKEVEDARFALSSPIAKEILDVARGPLLSGLGDIRSVPVVQNDKTREFEEFAKERGDTLKPSFTDFINQAKDPDWNFRKSVYSQFLSEGKGGRGGRTAGFITDLGVELASDPLSYVTGVGEVKYIGKAGRYLLAEKMLTKEMLAKYPQLAGKANDILRYGVWALPKEVRLAEGINTGIRLAGTPIKATEAVGDFVGPRISQARAKVWDAVQKLSLNHGFVVRESAKGLQEAGISATLRGVTYKMSEQEALQQVASWSARQYSRGDTAAAYAAAVDGIRQTIDEAKANGVDQNLAEVLDKVRNRPWQASQYTDTEWRLAQQLGEWQDKLYAQVEERYRQFGIDFDADVDPFSWVENYVHHRISRDARNWIRDNEGFSSGTFRTADLNMDDIMNLGQPLRFRKLKAGETFMGEELKYGDISEINEIFKRQTNTDIDFFETSGSAVADAYAYSMSKQLGREAFTRRMMAYGNDAAQKMIRTEVPDQELADGLRQGLRELQAARKEMVAAARLKMNTIGETLDSAVKAAERTVKDQVSEFGMKAQQSVRLANKLRAIEERLSLLRQQAQNIDITARGSFDTQHAVLLSEVRGMRLAIENANTEEATLRMVLQNAYSQMYPAARRIPDDIQVLADRIMAAKGAPSSREVRRINKRLVEIRRALDEGVADPALVAEEGRLKDLMNGYRVASEFRATQDYAPDNAFLYISRGGMDTDPFMKPFNLLESNPNMLQRDDIVGVRVLPNSRVLDSRTDIGVEQIFGAETFGGEFVTQLDAANIDSSIFRNALDELLEEGVVDPGLEEAYPEIADIMYNLMFNSSRQIMPMGSPDVINSIYDDLVNAATGLALRSGLANADQVGKTLIDSTLGQVARLAQDEDVADGLLLPARLFNDAAEADDVVVVVAPDFRVAPSRSVTADVQDANSPLLRSILDSDFTAASEGTAGRLAEISGRNTAVSRQQQALREELKKLSAQKGGLTAQTKRRQRTAEQAAAEYERLRNGEFTVTIGGKKVKLTRANLEKQLEKSLRQENRLRENLEREISGRVRGLRSMQDETAGQLQRTLLSTGERLMATLNEVRLMEAWDAGVGARIRSEIQYYGELLATMPAVDEAGVASREWVRKVQDTLNTSQILNQADPKVARAYDMLTDLLHFDEIGLAQLDDVITKQTGELAMAELGMLGPKVMYDTLAGWEKIAGLGIQMPEEVLTVFKPNLQKLITNKAEQGKFKDGVEWMNRMFKTYAIGSVGFVVRNSYSALFMNAVAGVDGTALRDGAKAMYYYRKYGAAQWLNKLGITDPAERAIYETALKARQATGRGMYSDIAEPAIKGTKGEKVINNFYTRFIRRSNEAVEDAVRFPMALDTIRKTGDFAEAVQRINRYHFDYSDLSELDRKALNFVPFWIWTTRNIPTQLANQFMRPQAYAVWENIQESLPIDGDLALPGWMQDYEPLGVVALGGPSSVVLRPDLPHQRLGTALESITNPKKLAGMMYPLYKVPIEMLAGKQLGIDTGPFPEFQEAKGIDRALAEILARTPGLTGETRKGRNKPREISGRASYAAGQFLPLIANLQRLSGGALGGKESYGKRTLSAWLNFFGIPYEQVGETQERAERLRRQFDIRDAVNEMVKLGFIPEQK